jgi:hypothetical protein
MVSAYFLGPGQDRHHRRMIGPEVVPMHLPVQHIQGPTDVW